MAIGVDLHFHAAITEDAFGHHGDHVDAVDLGRYDEGCWFVVGIGGTGANGGHEHARLVNDLAVPVATGLERHQPTAMRNRSLQHNMWINTHQFAVVIGIAIAGTRRARLNVTHYGASIAADLVGVSRSRCISRHEQAHRPASNSEIGNDALDRSLGSAENIVCFAAGHFVRIRMMLRACQIAVKRLGTKKCGCRINPQLHGVAVHKAGNGYRRGTARLHVCLQTVSSRGLNTIFAARPF